MRRFVATTVLLTVSGILLNPRGSSASLEPLQLTGFNRDVVVETGSVGPVYTTAQAFDFPILDPFNNNALYESGLIDGVFGLLPKGLASNGTISVPAIDTTFQLQPYDAANSLQLGSGSDIGVLQLAPADQARYRQIAILAAGGSTFGPASDQLTIYFDDGTTKSALVKTDDWFTSNTNIAIQDFGRVSLHLGGERSGPGQPRLYYTVIDLLPIERTKLITSFEFVRSDPRSGRPNFLAVSGSVIPEPGTLLLAAIGIGGARHRPVRSRKWLKA
jgi:hypothetical protein